MRQPLLLCLKKMQKLQVIAQLTLCNAECRM